MTTKIASAVLLIAAFSILFLGYAFLYSPLIEARERLQAQVARMAP